jgi:hypothetical protein
VPGAILAGLVVHALVLWLLLRRLAARAASSVRVEVVHTAGPGPGPSPAALLVPAVGHADRIPCPPRGGASAEQPALSALAPVQGAGGDLLEDGVLRQVFEANLRLREQIGAIRGAA